MRCIQRVSPNAHPYALLYHAAAHAVVLEHFDLPLISLRVNLRKRTGAVHALAQHHDPAGRLLVERAAISAYAGIAAEKYGCGRSAWFGARADCATVARRLARFTRDTGERAAWMFYLRERARVLVRAYWHEITVIAAVLSVERVMDRASLSATLAAFRRDPFKADLRPLRPIPCKPPAQAHGQDELVLVYVKPKLSSLVARIER